MAPPFILYFLPPTLALFNGDCSSSVSHCMSGFKTPDEFNCINAFLKLFSKSLSKGIGHDIFIYYANNKKLFLKLIVKS